MVSLESIFKRFGWGVQSNGRAPDSKEKTTGLNPQELLSKKGQPTPKTYFHTHIVERYDYSEGVKTYDRRDTISDFFSWSLFFPFEKMSNKLGENEFLSLTTDGKPNFKMTLMSEHATVHRITDRYRRAFVGRLPLESPNDSHTHHVPREFALGELAITHQLLQNISQLKLDFACLQLSEAELSTKIHETLENNHLWQAKDDITAHEIANRLAHSIVRSFTLAFIPAVFRTLEYKQKNKQETNLELGFIFTLLDKLQSESLLRYLKTKLAIFFRNHQLAIPAESFSNLEPEQIATIYQEISGFSNTPRTLIVPQASYGKSDPAFKDFFGRYFGSGELTYISVNGLLPEFQTLTQKKYLSSNTSTNDPALAILLADSYVPENKANPFRTLNHVEIPWILGQVSNQINEENEAGYIKETKQSQMSQAERARNYARKTKIWMITHDALTNQDEPLGFLYNTERRIEELRCHDSWFDEIKEIATQELGVQVNNQAQLVFIVLRGKKFENALQAKHDLLQLFSDQKIDTDHAVDELIDLCQKSSDQSLSKDSLMQLNMVVNIFKTCQVPHIFNVSTRDNK